MLKRVAPRFFQADTGDPVRITAIARDNGGFEGATFNYAGVPLGNVPVQVHPGCQFVVTHGVNILGAMLLFDAGSPLASYDLFEVDAAGNLIDLQANAPASSGKFTFIQIDGQPVAALAAATNAERFARAAMRATASPDPLAAVLSGNVERAARQRRPAGRRKAAKAAKAAKSKGGKKKSAVRRRGAR